MTFNGILSGVEVNPYNGRNYYKAGVIDDSPISERLKTEIVVGITEEEAKELQGKEGGKVQVTIRLFRAARNGLPEFEGRVTVKQTAAPEQRKAS